MSERRVPLGTKMLYGVADAGLNVANAALNQFLLFFYVDVLHVAPALVGVALFAGKFWDAVIDPAVGYISDTTRSRWGRRRPYAMASAIPMGICFYLIFAPPVGEQLALAWYLAATYIALFTFYTIFATPYLAWGAELTRDYHDRTAVAQVRAFFGVVGGVAGATLPLLIARQFSDQRVGFDRMALILAVVIVATALVTALGVRDVNRQPAPAASFGHFLGGLKQTFANRTFTVLFVTFCLTTIAQATGQAVQLIVVKYWLGLYDFFPILALTFGVSFIASFPLWMAISRRIGKRGGMMLGLGLGCVIPFGWLIVQPGQRGMMLLFMIVAGMASGSGTLAVSQAVDLVDLDELRTGEQRAGAYFGVWTLGLKTSNAIGTLLGGLLLGAVGYVPEVIQNPGTLWWLVILVGPLQAVGYGIGLLIFRRVRLGADDIERIQAELEARRERARGLVAAHPSSGSGGDAVLEGLRSRPLEPGGPIG